MTNTAALTNGTKVQVSERMYLTRGTGERVMYAIRTTNGSVVDASKIAYIY